MTTFRITYHMDSKGCTAESSIEVPIEDDYAEVVKTQSTDSCLLHPIKSLLHCLCGLQGYTRVTEICDIQEVKNDD